MYEHVSRHLVTHVWIREHVRRHCARGDSKYEKAVQEDVDSTHSAGGERVRPGLEFSELQGHRGGREGVSDDKEHVSDEEERSGVVQIVLP